MTNRITAAHVLQALDAAAEKGDFPAFDNLNVDYVSSRLTACRSDGEWAIVIHSIVWMDQRIQAFIEPFGSHVARRDQADAAFGGGLADTHKRFEDTAGSTGTGNFFVDFLSNLKKMQEMRRDLPAKMAEQQSILAATAAVEPTGAQPFIDCGHIELEEDDDDTQRIVSASVRGKSVPLSTLAIEPRPDLHTDPGFWAAVALVQRHRDALFASDEEIAAFFPHGVPARLLVLDDWQHPDISGGARPSDSSTFRMLAEAIVANDASLYAATEKPNTHWSNWLPK